MGVLWRLSVGGIWAISLYGMLQVTQWEGDWGYGVCGPWGCGPPLEVLVGWHGFWLVFLSLPVGWVIRRWPPGSMRRAGLGLLVAGLLGGAGVCVWEAVTWLPHIAPGQPTYFVQRVLFRIATLVEAPIVPIMLAGGLLLVCASVRRRSEARRAGEGAE